MVIEIVQSTSAAALVVGLIVLFYRMRNRFNRLVHRTLPKTRFPPGQITEIPMTNHPYQQTFPNTANSPFAPPLQSVPFSAQQQSAMFPTQHQSPAVPTQQQAVVPYQPPSATQGSQGSGQNFQTAHSELKTYLSRAKENNA